MNSPALMLVLPLRVRANLWSASGALSERSPLEGLRKALYYAVRWRRMPFHGTSVSRFDPTETLPLRISGCLTNSDGWRCTPRPACSLADAYTASPDPGTASGDHVGLVLVPLPHHMYHLYSCGLQLETCGEVLKVQHSDIHSIRSVNASVAHI
ncbi:hypothetical protein DAEQUDRAFT_555130 [Daedalea quercina L-15889]|uniref:Uncharacterized protein n=1 Tax=Daedalea quercina L-15889 TaxID=1314783 RepID=A0A165T575_9APHY|nr:hypothetical protein DAEQUDRAFT_555130 [Daedalea quercina L-15889]